MTYFYHSVVDSPLLPREIESESAPSLMLLLIGEFWRYSPELTIPSAALVELVRPLGVSAEAARASLSRLSRRGTLEVSRSGRRTSYALSPEVAATVPVSERLTMAFGREERLWDGEWTVVVFSLSEQERDRRQRLREWLRWLGFGPARDGVWVSPHADVSLVESSLVDFLPSDGLIFRSSHMVGDVNEHELWPLGEIREMYLTFISDLRQFVYRLRAGEVAPAEALKIALLVLGRWRGFPTVDPDLPAQYLPSDWPRREARRLFVSVYDACVPLANQYVRDVLMKYDPELARTTGALTVEEALEHYATQQEQSVDVALIER
ncbi:PaaX family transcriptional regulator [Subtercola frigoramans]|uniref:Phenylacetic acid degradation operon negative regulatory protein n=1 Tax=Subtercola frigoramans TaxID=120298 RepID=A0ABS2L0Z7_9MICO|nr:PaaX family transcriptional regulator C-terminal domain-containing protein [Subtercola frigoramans]MBM7470758.1 phenylacetic acid degradation operon negative regulatory protein [Subtercola frigoramans]